MDELNIPVPLKPRQQEIVRLLFMGWNSVQIALHLHMHPVTIRMISRSPLVKLELERLRARAEESLTNIPLREKLQKDLAEAATAAAMFTKNLISDAKVGVVVRQRASQHILDRVVFNKDDDDVKQTSYREILRRLDTLADGMREPTAIASGSTPEPAQFTPINESGPNENGGVAPNNEEEPYETVKLSDARLTAGKA